MIAIDEKIQDFRQLEYDFEHCMCDTEDDKENLMKYQQEYEYYKQLAEWLEELKTTRIALEKANGCLEANWKLGYQKAIEDFVDYAGDILSTSDRDFYCSGVIDEIAEQLKAGGTDV